MSFLPRGRTYLPSWEPVSFPWEASAGVALGCAGDDGAWEDVWASSSGREELAACCGERWPAARTWGPSEAHAQTTPNDATSIMEGTFIGNLSVVRCI